MPSEVRDRRQERHEAKKAEIVAEAWALARQDGLAAIPMRELADRVDLRQPSLYAYFDSKLGLYDLLFADGYRQLLAAVAELEPTGDPDEDLVAFVERCVQFSSADVERHQMLFQRTILGFEPSEESYALALEFYGIGQQRLTAAGLSAEDDVDLFSALVAGLTHQQVANDPGGDRWVRQARRAVELLLGGARGRS
ncbi:TetR family transcriptional regulator [cyanobacterium TDX16]|nr:TetR family transcriptional regulator [cyanobacterium TDX16]